MRDGEKKSDLYLAPPMLTGYSAGGAMSKIMTSERAAPAMKPTTKTAPRLRVQSTSYCNIVLDKNTVW